MEIGAGEDVPAYVIAISSMLIFVFGILKAGSIIFRKQGYDMVVSLPVRKGAVVLGRFLRIYTENLLTAALVLLPGIAVYAWKTRPDVSFYLCAFLGIWSVPLLPMTGAVLIGAPVMGISSRMRHKSLMASALTILSVFAIMYGSSRLSSVEGMEGLKIMEELSGMVSAMLGRFYPPAVLLGTAIVNGEIGRCLKMKNQSGKIRYRQSRQGSHFTRRLQFLCR